MYFTDSFKGKCHKPVQNDNNKLLNQFYDDLEDDDSYEIQHEVPNVKPIQKAPQQQKRAKLNLFQQEFEQTHENTPHIENDHLKQKDAYHQYQKSQAFQNFKKSNDTLLSNKHTGIQVKYFDKPIQSVQQVQQKQKQVKFNLAVNTLHPIEKNESEYLTFEEKQLLNRRISMHMRGIRFQDDDDDEDDSYSSQSEMVIEEDDYQQPTNQSQQIHNQVKSILKKNTKYDIKEQSQQNVTHKSHKKPHHMRIIKQLNHRQKQKKEEDYKSNIGIGFKLLQKIGFQVGTGLGADGQGILEPVEAVRKSQFTGQGDLSVEFMDQDEKYDQQQDEGEIIIDSKQLKKKQKLWKKKNNQHNKNDLETDDTTEIPSIKEDFVNLDRNSILNNLMTNQSDQSFKSKPYQIFDMTGTDTKEYLTVKELPTTKDVREYLNNIQNLQWSVQNLLEKKLGRLEQVEQNIKKENDKILILTHERKEEEEFLQKLNLSVERKTQFLKYLSSIDNNYMEKYEECLKNYTEEFSQYNLSGYLVKMTEQQISQIQWSGPVSNTNSCMLINEFNLIKNCVCLIKDALIFKKSQNLSRYAEQLDVIIVNNQISETDIKLLKRYIGFLIRSILQKLRTYLLNFWDPQKDNYLLEFLQIWSQDIFVVETDDSGENKYQKIAVFDEQMLDIQSIILPKLEQSINDWTFNKNQDQNKYLHIWVLPWLKSKFKCQDLIKSIVAKLNQLQWQADEEYGYQILHPWAKYLGDKWNNILLRNVIPKIMHLIINTEINPSNQIINGINSCLLWSDVLDEHLGLVFEKLIEKIGKTLDRWMLQDGNVEEMKIWLEGWEEYLYRKILSKVYKFQAQFNLMKAKLHVYQTK